MPRHAVKLEVVVIVDGMNNTPEESADSAWEEVERILKEHFIGEVVTTVDKYEEIEEID